ncbi:plasmid stabilization protein [Nocardia sp. CA2R105]|uniref:plasmid stabilization protein n=1 Tax=Nocardia coffeae TaxID=2873381 RepID=UPI001CA5FCA7|nr:plasmid stabilization protein [Nocardia coffeae]MBY8857178.1 plasmid stabilization protein [Nocardia coffeae]
MPEAWTDKQEREYRHIRDSEKSRGASKRRAEEIAARTVNKNRAQSGRTRTASRSTIEDLSPQRRGGQRSHSGAQSPTRDQLYNEARQRNIEGRSKMNKSQLAHALGRD